MGRVAQLGEHRPYKPRVTGSSPVPPTIRYGVVVQLVRMPACHAGGREFESRRPRQEFQGITKVIPFFVPSHRQLHFHHHLPFSPLYTTHVI